MDTESRMLRKKSKQWLWAGTLSFFTLPLYAAHTPDPLTQDTDWELEHLTGWQGTELKQLSTPITLGFKQTELAGMDGCNYFSGQILKHDANTQALELKLGMSTLMACLKPELQQLSRLYLERLGQTQAYQLKADTLQLLNQQGEILISFKRAASHIENTTWQLQAYYDGRTAFIADQYSPKVTANFLNQGKLSGNTSCRHYTASYTVTGNQLKIAAPSLSGSACQDFQALKVEKAFISDLVNTVRFRRSGKELELFNAKDLRLLRFNLK